MAQTVKNLPAMQEIWVWSLGQEDPLQKGIATHSSILAWKIPRTLEPGGLQSMGSQRVRHYWATVTHKVLCRGFPGGARGKEPACQCKRHKRGGFHTFLGKIPWRRAWQPTLAFLPEESHGQSSLVGYSLVGHRSGLDLARIQSYILFFLKVLGWDGWMASLTQWTWVWANSGR